MITYYSSDILDKCTFSPFFSEPPQISNQKGKKLQKQQQPTKTHRQTYKQNKKPNQTNKLVRKVKYLNPILCTKISLVSFWCSAIFIYCTDMFSPTMRCREIPRLPSLELLSYSAFSNGKYEKWKCIHTAWTTTLII